MLHCLILNLIFYKIVLSDRVFCPTMYWLVNFHQVKSPASYEFMIGINPVLEFLGCGRYVRIEFDRAVNFRRYTNIRINYTDRLIYIDDSAVYIMYGLIRPVKFIRVKMTFGTISRLDIYYPESQRFYTINSKYDYSRSEPDCFHRQIVKKYAFYHPVDLDTWIDTMGNELNSTAVKW